MISQTWLRTAVAVLAMAVLGLFTFTNLDARYDLSYFQPGVPSRISELAIDQVRSGPASRTILIAISGAASSDLARLSRSLALALSASSQFRHVANGANQLDEASLQFLIENRYLLGPALDSGDFTSDAMRRSITSALGKLSGLSGYAFGDLLPSDPRAE